MRDESQEINQPHGLKSAEVRVVSLLHESFCQRFIVVESIWDCLSGFDGIYGLRLL